MPQTDMDRLKEALRRHWPGNPGDKAKRYIGRFFNETCLGTKITAQVMGNHGTYTVSIRAGEQGVTSTCSCYIGKRGYCHHCAALSWIYGQYRSRTSLLRRLRQVGLSQ